MARWKNSVSVILASQVSKASRELTSVGYDRMLALPLSITQAYQLPNFEGTMISANPIARQQFARAAVITLFAATTHWFAAPSSAQQTATAATATAVLSPGARAAGPGGLTREQQNATVKLDYSTAALMDAIAIARTNLNAAVFSENADAASIKPKLDALAAAEAALANARIAEFRRLQSSALKLNTDQVTTVVQNSGRSGRASGAPDTTVTRRPGFLADRAALLSQGGPILVMLGDSITDGWRNTGRTVFTNAYAQYRTYNIGIGGIRTQNVMNQIEMGDLDGTDPKAAMLMIGTNNLPGGADSDESVAAGIAEIVNGLRRKLPNTKILLLGIFPRAVSATDPLRARIKNVNGMIAKLDDGKFVKYLDIGAKFLAADGTLTPQIMPDALHPNAAGYQIWADAVKDVIADMVK